MEQRSLVILGFCLLFLGIFMMPSMEVGDYTAMRISLAGIFLIGLSAASALYPARKKEEEDYDY